MKIGFICVRQIGLGNPHVRNLASQNNVYKMIYLATIENIYLISVRMGSHFIGSTSHANCEGEHVHVGIRSAIECAGLCVIDKTCRSYNYTSGACFIGGVNSYKKYADYVFLWGDFSWKQGV